MNNTILYHGTVDAYIPSIERDGLKPIEANAWRVTWPSYFKRNNLREVEKVNAVYLTPFPDRAVWYAKAKARYLALPHNAPFVMSEDGDTVLTKDSDAPIIKTRPALVEVTISNDFIRFLLFDSREPEGFKTKHSIPATWITKVKVL